MGTTPSPGLIWVVDDDPDVAAHLRIRLQRAGHDAEVRGIGDAEAVRAALDERSAPTLVLLDHYLPGTTGIALLAQIRDALPEARIAMISAAPEEVRPLVGDVEVLGKPLDVDRIRALLESVAVDVD